MGRTWSLDDLLSEHAAGFGEIGLRDVLGDLVREALGLPADGKIVFLAPDDHTTLLELCRDRLPASSGARREALERIIEALEPSG